MAEKILIVDDEPSLVLSLELLLSQAGFSVSTAGDGRAAIASLTACGDDPSRLPDLILLDIIMPQQNGFEVCQLIRQHPAWQTIKIIMLTAKARAVDREKGLALGADDYITKPFSAHELIERVRAALAESPTTAAPATAAAAAK